MEDKQIELLYSELLRDTDFKKLEIVSKSSNIFEILGIQNYEIRHSNFLGWLLDPNGNHGLGSSFLKSFLNDLSIDDRSQSLSIINLQRFDFVNVQIYREWNNIDLLIEFENLVVAIENKLNHYETEGQLIKYKTIIEQEFDVEHTFFVYLNRDGEKSSMNEIYINYSYESILNYLEQIIKLQDSILLRTKVYIEDYIKNLRNNIMGNGEKYLLANRIYNQHKDLLDFIFESKGNEMDNYKNLLENRIRDQGWILTSLTKQYLRFTTPELNEFIPNGVVKSWKNGELFLFEVYFYQAQNQISVYCTIGPSENPKRKVLLSSLSSLKSHKGDSKSYSTYKNKTFKVVDVFKSNEEEDVNWGINQIWQYINKIVNEVEPLILKDKEKIIESK